MKMSDQDRCMIDLVKIQRDGESLMDRRFLLYKIGMTVACIVTLCFISVASTYITNGLIL